MFRRKTTARGDVHPVDEVLPVPRMTLFGLQHVHAGSLARVAASDGQGHGGHRPPSSPQAPSKNASSSCMARR
jgi:hypothetical protein